MIKSVVAAGVITVLWIVCGFSLAFGESIGGIIGNPKTFLFFQGGELQSFMEPGSNYSAFVVCCFPVDVCDYYSRSGSWSCC